MHPNSSIWHSIECSLLNEATTERTYYVYIEPLCFYIWTTLEMLLTGIWYILILNIRRMLLLKIRNITGVFQDFLRLDWFVMVWGEKRTQASNKKEHQWKTKEWKPTIEVDGSDDVPFLIGWFFGFHVDFKGWNVCFLDLSCWFMVIQEEIHLEDQFFKDFVFTNALLNAEAQSRQASDAESWLSKVCQWSLFMSIEIKPIKQSNVPMEEISMQSMHHIHSVPHVLQSSPADHDFKLVSHDISSCQDFCLPQFPLAICPFL